MNSNLKLEEIKQPKYKWKCNLFGGSDNDIVLQVMKPPNWFWRWMQYLIVGNKWKKL
jgi:hypothetical protein